MAEKFIDVSKYKFVLEPRYYFFGWSGSPKVVGRQSVVKALAKARLFLPRGYNFKIWDLQRPRYVQLAMLNSFRRRFQVTYPYLSKKEIEKLVFKFGAKPLIKVVRLDTHRSGGAVDLTIVNKQGEELYMGTDHDELTDKAATDYFETIKRPNVLQLEAKKNRRLLSRVLTAVGFENYKAEWWHWSRN